MGIWCMGVCSFVKPWPLGSIVLNTHESMSE
jgi:hypothetical protein